MKKPKNEKRIGCLCAGCGRTRLLRPVDWRKRKTDYCNSCVNRIRIGLAPSISPSGKGTRLYNIWRGMRQRCGYIAGGHAHDVKHYADRGITVCDEWRMSFQPFKDWAEMNGYEPHLVIDRRDNDFGYSPDNCRWVTVLISNRNKRSVLGAADRQTVREEISRGVKQCVLARRFCVTDATITHIKQETA